MTDAVFSASFRTALQRRLLALLPSYHVSCFPLKYRKFLKCISI